MSCQLFFPVLYRFFPIFSQDKQPSFHRPIQHIRIATENLIFFIKMYSRKTPVLQQGKQASYIHDYGFRIGKAQLFDCNFCSNFFHLFFDVFCFFFGNSFFDVLRSAVNNSFCFFKTKTCDLTNNFDNFNFLSANFCQLNIEFCLLFCFLSCSCCTCCNYNTCCCGYAELFLTCFTKSFNSNTDKPLITSMIPELSS